MLILVTIATFLSTLLGGLFALKFKDRLHLILGFSAGAIIGVAFFDLLPEAIELGSGSYSVAFITSISALGFIVYTILDRFVFFHSQNENGDLGNNEQAVGRRGLLGAASLSAHSFMDG